jgi:hypothetical protein
MAAAPMTHLRIRVLDNKVKSLIIFDTILKAYDVSWFKERLTERPTEMVVPPLKFPHLFYQTSKGRLVAPFCLTQFLEPPHSRVLFSLV